MTITRIFSYATLATCSFWASVACAHPTFDDESTVASPAVSADAPAHKASPSKPHTTVSHVATKAAPVSARSGSNNTSPKAANTESYRLSHQARLLDSYQNA